LLFMDAPDALYRSLDVVDQWASRMSPLPLLNTNDEFMTLAMEAMNYCQYLIGVAISVVPTEIQSEKGLMKRRAIVLGHLVRIYKLYDALRYHTAKREGDICAIFIRLLVETAAKMEYLMKARASTFKNFVLVSYRSEKEMIADLTQKAASRPLIPIEKRMIRSVRWNLKEDRISVKELVNNRRWDLDGKSFRQILTDLGRDSGYAYGFGIGSHYVHGDWFDLKTHHLQRAGGRYQPKMEQSDPDPRTACPPTILCLSYLIDFVKWNRSDIRKALRPIIERVLNAVRDLDEAHEEWLQRQ
jgi:hypothetical protein